MKLNRHKMYFAQHEPKSWAISESQSTSDFVQIGGVGLHEGGFSDWKFWTMQTLRFFDDVGSLSCWMIRTLADLHDRHFLWMLGKNGFPSVVAIGWSQQIPASSRLICSELVFFNASPTAVTLGVWARDERCEEFTDLDERSLDNFEIEMIVSFTSSDLTFCKRCKLKKIIV